MALQVGIVGLPNSGKTTLFNALTHAGAEVSAYASVVEKPNLGVAVIPDDHVARLAAVVGSRKVTPAAIRVVDVPGASAEIPGDLRRVDALLAVVDGFSDDADPARDLEALKLEMMVADGDHVERRLDKVRKEAKSGDPSRRKEVTVLEEILAHLESGMPLASWEGSLPSELEPLTTKPLLPVENGPEESTASWRWSLPSFPTPRPRSFARARRRSTRS